MRKSVFKILAMALVLVLCIGSLAFATLSVTITRTLGTVNSLERIRDFTVTFDNSYATGGEAFVASDIALASIYSFACQPTSGYTISYNYVSSILVYDISGVASAGVHEVDNARDLSALTTRCRATGR